MEREGKVIGMSSFGVRLRHREVERVIARGQGWASVNADLKALLFDPEFSHHAFEFYETTADALPPKEQGYE